MFNETLSAVDVLFFGQNVRVCHSKMYFQNVHHFDTNIEFVSIWICWMDLNSKIDKFDDECILAVDDFTLHQIPI